MEYLELTGHSIREGFKLYHKKNPHIYEMYEQEVFKTIAAGQQIVSSKLIISTIRSWGSVQTDDEHWKIDDSFCPYYAREFLRLHPGYIKYFKLRKLRNEKPGEICMKILENGQYYFLPDEEYL
jgi:hypothetical protein